MVVGIELHREKREPLFVLDDATPKRLVIGVARRARWRLDLFPKATARSGDECVFLPSRLIDCRQRSVQIRRAGREKLERCFRGERVRTRVKLSVLERLT